MRLVTVVLGADFGLFVRDEDGAHGLINIPEIHPTQRFSHPLDHFDVGETLHVVVLVRRDHPSSYRDIDYTFGASHRRWLELQHGTPWTSEFLFEGLESGGIVTRTTEFGVFVDFEAGPFIVSGSIHIDDLDAQLVKGDFVRCVVKSVNVEERKVHLELKQ